MFLSASGGVLDRRRRHIDTDAPISDPSEAFEIQPRSATQVKDTRSLRCQSTKPLDVTVDRRFSSTRHVVVLIEVLAKHPRREILLPPRQSDLARNHRRSDQ